MDTDSPLPELDKRWRSTCKVVLKEEVGALSDFARYLSAPAGELEKKQSALSQRDVYFAIREYCEGSKRIAFDETQAAAEKAKVGINDMKDIDSLLHAVSENAFYAGGVVLGNSSFVEQSSNISDSFQVFASSMSTDSKYIAYCRRAKECESTFGCDAPGNSSFIIRCNDTYKAIRCLEAWCTSDSNDCYYVRNLADCSECMFSFQLKSKRHCIGNLPLEKGKYFSLKEKLLSEIAEKLKKEKSLPSLIEIAGRCKSEPKATYSKIKGAIREEDMGHDKSKIETAFSSTTKLLFGTELSGIDNYKAYLTRHTGKFASEKSALSGKPILKVDYGGNFLIPQSRLATHAECRAIGALVSIDEESAESLTLESAHEILCSIAYFTTEHYVSTNLNIIECPVMGYCANCYRSAPAVSAKECGYSFWPRHSDHCFGFNVIFASSFCINCYHSVKLSRCFEVDSSRDCADSYFCHNCENVQNGIFCFNAKNLRYAVGNVEVGREKYLQVKGALLRRIVPALESGKDPGLDIFNIACIAQKQVTKPGRKIACPQTPENQKEAP
ncbi:MAG: hypothetical protein NT051_00435 [Candidatus Micrarchaeota archaeon]|nr:hypothetical protein [Candidatus Micrarchaeota archaeon]